MEKHAWYEKHGITPDADGWFAGLPKSKGLPVSPEKWVENIRINMQRDVPNAQARPFNPRTMVMVCGGVSARDHLEDIRAKAASPDYDVFCSNKTGQWLLEKGIVPQYHLVIDSKAEKVKDVTPSHPDITYLLAVNVDPGVFDALANRTVLRFFCPSNLGEENLDFEELKKHLTGPMLMVCGGTMAGVRAIHLADALGYRRLEYYGFDACLASKDEHYAYDKKHYEAILDVECEDGRRFVTTHIFADQVRQVQEITRDLPWLKIAFHGDSFMSHMMALDRAKQEAKRARGVLITPEYKAQQKQMHSKGNYGVSGHKHAKTIRGLIDQLVAKYGAISVLDYGCGQGGLGKALGSIPGVEFREYDACIEGKDAPPEPADIVVCSDVMEHIEEACVSNVLDHIESLTKKLAFFWIATKPAIKTLPDGRNAHITLHPGGWWYKKIHARFLVCEAKEYEGASAFVGQALEAVRSEYKPKPIAPQESSGTKIQTVSKGEVSARFAVVNDITRFRVETFFTKEPVTIDWLGRMKPGEVLFDIGANVGMYSIWAALHGVKVYAFEPAAPNYELLCRNIHLNRLADDVTAYCLALSNRPSLDSLHLPTLEAGGSCNEFAERIGHDLQPKALAYKHGCVGMRLADLNLPAPDHIKIDVDGLEHQVVEGGMEVIAGAKSVLVEVNENLPRHREMVALLSRMGFAYKQHQVDLARRKAGPFAGCAEYLFTRGRDEIDALIDKIMAAELVTEPFPHLYLQGVFDPRLYAEMLTNVANTEYRAISEVRNVKGYPERSVHDMTAPFWKALNDLMTDGRLKQAVCAKFGCFSPGLRDETLLMRDVAGYSVGPHTDTMKKVATLLFYLPQDDSMRAHGTSIYAPKVSGFTCDGSRHYLSEGFNLLRTMPFVPNSLFAFLKTNNSFHGVGKFEDGTRNTLLYDIKKA